MYLFYHSSFFIDTVMKGLCSIMLITETEKFLLYPPLQRSWKGGILVSLSMGGSYILYFRFYIVILLKVNNTQWQFACRMSCWGWYQTFFCSSEYDYWWQFHFLIILLGVFTFGVDVSWCFRDGEDWDDLEIRTLIQYKDVILPIY